MATYYRWKGSRIGNDWVKIDDDVDLKAFGLKLLEGASGRDSDNGYSEYIEFDRNSVRTYAYASFSTFYDGYCGEMQDFDYGSLEYLKRFYSANITPYALSPGRDYLLLK